MAREGVEPSWGVSRSALDRVRLPDSATRPSLQVVNASGESRTHTGPFLRRLPAAVGLRSRVGVASCQLPVARSADYSMPEEGVEPSRYCYFPRASEARAFPVSPLRRRRACQTDCVGRATTCSAVGTGVEPAARLSTGDRFRGGLTCPCTNPTRRAASVSCQLLVVSCRANFEHPTSNIQPRTAEGAGRPMTFPRSMTVCPLPFALRVLQRMKGESNSQAAFRRPSV